MRIKNVHYYYYYYYYYDEWQNLKLQNLLGTSGDALRSYSVVRRVLRQSNQAQRDKEFYDLLYAVDIGETTVKNRTIN